MSLRKLSLLLFLLPGILFAQTGTINGVPNQAVTALQTGGLFTTNAQTATYQVLASDFQQCKAITVASGTFTVTLVASTSQPATGQCVWVINYGTGVVTIARSGQNINGGTASLSLAAGSATAPTGVWIVSDGTNYEATLFGASSGGVTSFSGDGTLLSNSSSTGGVTATLATAGAHKFWGNNTGSTAAPGYDSVGVNDLLGSYVAGGGTAQAQTATLSPAATALTAGIEVLWKPTAANTAAAPTLAVNGLTATAITKCGTTALVANDITTTAIADAIYDGTEFQLVNPQAAGCGSGGSLPSSTGGQTFTSNNTTAAATSLFNVIPGATIGSSFAATNGACSSATTTSCAITGGGNLSPNGGVAVFGYESGDGFIEYACYTAATSTTITFGQFNAAYCSTTGRGSMGSTATTWGGSTNVAAAILVVPGTSNTAAPVELETQDTNMFFGMPGSALAANTPSPFNFGGALSTPFVYLTTGNGQSAPEIRFINTSGIALLATNGNPNFVGSSNTADRNISTQTINSNTSLQAITGAVTPAYPANVAAASNTVHGQLESDCEIIWQQATGVATVSFGVNLSAAVTGLQVLEEDYGGASGALSGTKASVITSTGATTTSNTITPGAATTTYFSKLTLIMNPGTTNSPTVALYGATSNTADALSVLAGTGCTSWH